eukprot:TRINITY_DN11721_c0_g1_i1.p1 TRINITY_DN11721_c0_g1~~TRINITY_DN11721_c0_g1_i1.p1  ORF type:complete len:404 (-),score=63.47 TRINITY_DN11721_c0_g1_i1:101-1312(-)
MSETSPLVLFLYPNFPANWRLFVTNLVRLGCRVIAVGDAPWEAIGEDLQKNLTEYWRLYNAEDYNELKNAVSCLIQRHGKISRVSSHTEYWLRFESRIRTDFGIEDGYIYEEIQEKQQKSVMKDLFRSVGVPVARGKVIENEAEILEFAEEVGYPLCAKPNTGVGANGAFKIKNENDVREFCRRKEKDYIIEEFIQGKIVTFDGLVDLNGSIVFYSSFELTKNIMEALLEHDDNSYHIAKTVAPDLYDYGTRIVRQFNIRNGEFFHIEFFRKFSDNTLVALEINMRPPGGPTVDMINFAYNIDLYRQWANIVVYNQFTETFVNATNHIVGFASRRYGLNYLHSYEDVVNTYGDQILVNAPLPEVWRAGMGDWQYVFKTKDFAKFQEIVRFIQTRETPSALQIS